MPYVNGKSQIMKEHGSTNYVHPELGLNLLKQIELLNNHFLNTVSFLFFFPKKNFFPFFF